MCPSHDEAKQAEMTEFGAEKVYFKVMEGAKFPEGFWQRTLKSLMRRGSQGL